MKWSKYQIPIFEALTKTTSNISVEATAGSGKTTTALECLNRIPSHKDSIFLSFSNTIVDELKQKVPSYVEATTLHSLGCRVVNKKFPKAAMMPNKYFQLNLDSYKKSEFSKKVFIESFQIEELCNFIRMTMTPLNNESVLRMALHYGLQAIEEKQIEKAIELVEKNSNGRGLKTFDFTDMIYIPATRPQLIDRAYDYVFLDEAQDCNNCQRLLIEGLLKTQGRLITIGDRRQSIFAFQGADIQAFESFSLRPNTVTLPLSVSYRCGKNIVEYARQVYQEIQPFEGNHDGVVLQSEITDIREGDMVLCRKNSPLISLFFQLVDKEVKASIRGREIEQGVLKLVEECMSRSEDTFIDKLERKLETTANQLMNRGVNKPYKHPRYEALFEKVEIILLILNKVELSLLVQKVKEIFHDDGEGVRLMTIHKSKGLESDRVFIIEKYNGEKMIPNKNAELDWELVQERNLKFVAITRAKKELHLVNYYDNF